MADKALILRIKALLDPESINKMVEDIEKQDVSLNVKVNTSAGKGVGTSKSEAGAIADAQGSENQSKDTAAGAKSYRDILFRMATGTPADEMSDEAKKQTKLLQLGQEATAAGIKGLTGITQGSFQFLEMIYNQLKSASPLLRTIESLFNLAVTLFFMPLGNKLAEVLLPAVLELVDNVVEMWDAMEGMSLSQMITYMMEVGVSYFAQFFQDIGALLGEQGGLLGSIGDLLTFIGDFLEHNAADLLGSILGVINFVLDYLKEIISLIVALYTMQYTMQLMSMYVNAIGKLPFGLGTAGALGVIAAAGLGSFALTELGLSSLGMADGGYVPATEGGQVRILGEGGQGEYVIPEDQVGSLGGTTNNYYYFNGYTDDDILRIIRDEVSTQISQSRIRGGF